MTENIDTVSMCFCDTGYTVKYFSQHYKTVHFVIFYTRHFFMFFKFHLHLERLISCLIKPVYCNNACINCIYNHIRNACLANNKYEAYTGFILSL